MESTSLVKALGLLEATAQAAAGRQLADLAAEVGLAKPTAHRILKTLTSLGYLERTAGGVYRQTSQVQRLVSNDLDHRLHSVAAPLLNELHQKTLETVNLGVLRYDRVIYLTVLESPQPLRRVATPNSVDPFHCTALGRAIASHLPDEQRESLLQVARLDPSTNRTNTDRRKLEAILAKAARDGYAVEVDETDVGVTCVGAPILLGNVACAAVSLSVPTVRASDKLLPGLIACVRQTVRSISAALSGASPPAASPVRTKRSRVATARSQR